MIWKELRKKTWIDWIKIIVAIDITGVGIGLILGFDMHIFAHILGFLSRTFFGLLYVLVAYLIFRRVFPQELAEEEHIEAKKMDEEIIDTTNIVKKGAKKIAQKAHEFTEKAYDTIDDLLDKGESFVGKRKQEVQEEVKKLMKD